METRWTHLARFHTTSLVPCPIEATGLVSLSSSSVIVNMRFWSPRSIRERTVDNVNAYGAIRLAYGVSAKVRDRPLRRRFVFVCSTLRPVVYCIFCAVRAHNRDDMCHRRMRSLRIVTKRYNSCGLGLMSSPDAVAGEAEKLFADGFRALKLRLGYPDAGGGSRRRARGATLHRRGHSTDGRLHPGAEPCRALERGRALDQEDIFWLEEPIRHDTILGTRPERPGNRRTWDVKTLERYRLT